MGVSHLPKDASDHQSCHRMTCCFGTWDANASLRSHSKSSYSIVSYCGPSRDFTPGVPYTHTREQPQTGPPGSCATSMPYSTSLTFRWESKAPQDGSFRMSGVYYNHPGPTVTPRSGANCQGSRIATKRLILFPKTTNEETVHQGLKPKGRICGCDEYRTSTASPISLAHRQ
jgi:hypothetical protein